MIKLPSVFSSGALYQHSSVLTLRGSASREVEAALIGPDGKPFDSASASAADGSFSVTLKTPPASLLPCRIVLHDGDGELTLDDILFGELWLASGQSNMELNNGAIDTNREYRASLAGMPLRVYRQNVLSNKPFEDSELARDDFPIEPSDMLEGVWGAADDPEIFDPVSAAATAFVKRLQLLYKQSGRDIPVGFLNCNMGATAIEGWLPAADLDEDDELTPDYLHRPDPERWNTFGGNNFLQASALYNLKVWPLRGLKLAGVIWYQGESNIGRPDSTEKYKRLMRRYHHAYKELFAAGDGFRVVMSLLYPFTYGHNSECRMSCINNAMSELAHDEPQRFTAVPIYDLSPIWGYEPFYHPIHPTNKYPLGERMADAFFSGVTAPTLHSCERDGSRLLLRFDDLNGALRICGKRLRGLYIRGEDTPYVEADGELLDGETIAVSHPYLDTPVHVAYQLSSLACDGNLYGGSLPVAQFCTEDPYDVVIERKAWLFTENSAEWFCDCLAETDFDGYWDFAMHPTWQPLPGSEVCSDPVFKKNIASLRVCGETNVFGAFVKRRRYNELDLQRYDALRFVLLNAAAVSGENGSVRAELRFRRGNGEEYILTRRARRLSEPDFGWAEFILPFGELPDDLILSMSLIFDVGRCRSHFVNIDCLRLIPKGAAALPVDETSPAATVKAAPHSPAVPEAKK